MITLLLYKNAKKDFIYRQIIVLFKDVTELTGIIYICSQPKLRTFEKDH